MTASPTAGAFLSADWTAPAVDAVAVTPSDSVNFTTGPSRALYVGGAGTVVLVTAKGNIVTFVGVLAGSILPIQVLRVNSTSTTATSMVALF